MRLLHLADLHIGKIVNNFSMLEDQSYILDQIIELVKEYKPNAVILAGDIYDRSVPPAEAVSLLNKFLDNVLIGLNTPVLAIAGNHDSADRLQFGSNLFAKNNLFIEGVFTRNIRKVKLNDEYGPVNFYLVPFADSPVVREAFDNAEVKCLNDAMKCIVEKIEENLEEGERHVMITHGYITEGGNELETCESEKNLVIGGTEYVDVSLFNKFHYTALGHLHCPQKAGSERVRYAGSPLKYSFSEEKHKKSATLVDLDQDGNVNISLLELKPLRDMRSIKGNLDGLTSPGFYNHANRNDYIRAVLTDDGELIEPMAKLRQVYPNTMILEIERKDGFLNTSFMSSKERMEKTPIELFKSFYKFHTRREMSELELEIAQEIFVEIENEVE